MQLLISRITNTHINRGDIVEPRASNTPLGGSEPASFVILEIVEPMAALKAYANKVWQTSIQYSIVTQDLANDAFVIELTSSTAGVTLGKVARNHVEAFINNWGGTVVSETDNAVRFSITIYNAIKSIEFWDVDPAKFSLLVFTELSYTQAGGVHRVQCDHSAFGGNPTFIETMVEDRGATVISHANNVIVFEVNRATVRDRFIEDIRQKGKKDVRRFRYSVSDPLVTQAEAAPGQILITDLATIQANLVDKVTL